MRRGDEETAVVREAGLAPLREEWAAPSFTAFATTAELVAWTRRRLCLPAERDPEIAAALATSPIQHPADGVTLPPRAVVTLWWSGEASSASW